MISTCCERRANEGSNSRTRNRARHRHRLETASWFFLWPHFSHDGQTVLFHLPRSSGEYAKFDVWSAPVTGGTAKVLVREASLTAPFPDGKTIAYVSGARGLRGQSLAIADPRSSSSRTLVEASEAIWWPAVSPDGAKIAYVIDNSAWLYGGSVSVVDVATDSVTEVAEGKSAEWLDDHTLIVNP